MAILGLDIGGANIKAADLERRAVSRPFAVWRQPDKLHDEIDLILKGFPQTDQIALTMTAELADCFSTKSEGVRFIVNCVEACAHRLHLTYASGRNASDGSAGQAAVPVKVWSTDGGFLDPVEACSREQKVAAANWHALGSWCAKLSPNETGLLIDIGSTTTDVIPLRNGQPVPTGLTDLGRLQSGELSYSGVWRTPLCAVAHSVPFGDGYCPLAAELFATTLDVYLLLDRIPEDPLDIDTANGKPVTKAASHDRIARMVCCDREEVSFEQARQIARFLADVQRQRLAGSLERVLHGLGTACQFVIVSGSGRFLARQLIDENRRTSQCRVISLSEILSDRVSEAACAFAVANLAAES